MFSSFPLCSHYYILIQTLATLDLWRNQIGDKGVPYFAKALHNNRVTNVFFLCIMCSPYVSIQTLTRLNLRDNGISSEVGYLFDQVNGLMERVDINYS
jgi:hypothetical protein